MMKRFMSAVLASAMLVTGAAQLAFARTEKTELFAFDETIGVFDKTSGEEIAKTEIPSGSKVGVEGNLVTWGTSNADKLSASVVADVEGANGEAFKISYTKQLLSSGDSKEFLKADITPIEYSDITEDKPLILEFNEKVDWNGVADADMKAWIDVVPVIKPETGNTLENNPFIQQSVQPAKDNGIWHNVKYVIKKIAVGEDNIATITFDRYIDETIQQQDKTAAMAAGSGAGARIIGLKIRPRARTTSYSEGGYMNITFDNIHIYREETIIPTGTKWGEDLTVNDEHKSGPVESGTVIGDNNTVTAYKLANSDGDVQGYSAQITDDNSSLIINNVCAADNYKSTLTPVSPKKYTTEDIGENGALVYEARYKIDYNLAEGSASSYSAVQMLFDFYRSADNKMMSFSVPATTKASGEYITVKVIIPKGTFEKTAQPYLFTDNSMKAMSATIDDVEYISLRRVAFANKLRSGQNAGDEKSAATLTLDYLDQYVIEETEAFNIEADDLADNAEIAADTVGVDFTATHYIDKSTVTKAVLKKKSAEGVYEAIDSAAYGVKSTGDKTFYMGFGGSLVTDGEYEIDLSAVKDIYGNSVDKKMYFKTEKGYCKWLDCAVSGNTVSYKINNGTSGDADGVVYVAVVNKQSERLIECRQQEVVVEKYSTFENDIVIEGLSNECEIRLFFWNDDKVPYLEKKTVSIE